MTELQMAVTFLAVLTIVLIADIIVGWRHAKKTHKILKTMCEWECER